MTVPLLEEITISALRCDGQDDGCCTSDNPCEFGEGDCDRDSHCKGGNTCGTDNCWWGDYDDCCEGGKFSISIIILVMCMFQTSAVPHPLPGGDITYFIKEKWLCP